MKREKFDGLIWECACGTGRMARVLSKYNLIKASDIVDGNDFLLSREIVPNIVTNPPYNLAVPFVQRALELAEKKVAMFLRLNFLEGQSRYSLFVNSPLKTVWVFCKRQTLCPEGAGITTGGTIAYAWFVWDKQYLGLPYLDWIND